MNLSLGEIILFAILAVVVWAFVSGKIDTKRLKTAIADLRDDGKLNGSVYAQPVQSVDHAQIVTAALQGAAAVTAAAKPSPAPIASPEPAKPVALAQPAAPVINDITDRLFKPSSEVGAILDARVGSGGGQPAWTEEPFPATFVRRRLLCRLEPGVAYCCAFAEAGGYMIAVATGQGTRLAAWVSGQPEPSFDGQAVDSARFDGQAGQVWCLKAERACSVWLDA